jgi:beta-galactosidase
VSLKSNASELSSTLPTSFLKRIPRSFPRVAAIIFCFCVSSALLSRPVIADTEQDSLAPTQSSPRLIIPLSGEWKYAEISDTSSGSWKSITIPATSPEHGVLDYRKTFEIAAGTARGFSWSFETDRSTGEVEILINGRILRIGAGKSRTEIQIPAGMLRDGKNHIDLVIDDRLSANSTIPLRSPGLAPKMVEGLVHSVSLVGKPLAHVASIAQVSSSPETSGRKFRITFQNTANIAQDCEYSIQLRDPTTGEIAARVDGATLQLKAESEETTEVLLKSPTLGLESSGGFKTWSIEAPNLYDVSVTLSALGVVTDRQEIRTGFRSFTIQKHESFALNGQSIRLQGSAYCEAEFVRGEDRAKSLERDLKLIKSLGANTIRLHVPPSNVLLELCDAMGLMVMIELPISNAPASILLEENYASKTESMLQTLIRLAKEHPCVIAFGLGSENDDADPAVKAYLTTLAEKARGWDVSHEHLFYFVTRFANNPFALDFAALSTFGVASELEVTRAFTLFRDTHRGKVPCIVAAHGSLVTIGDLLGTRDLHSEQSQARTIAEEIRIGKLLGFAGDIVGAFADYHAEYPVTLAKNADQFLVSAGLVDQNRKPRFAFDAVRAAFANEKPSDLESGVVANDSPLSFLLIGVLLILILLLLINADRRFREYMQRALFRPFNFFADIRDQRLIPSAQTVMLAVAVAGSLTLVLGSLLLFAQGSYAANWVLPILMPWHLVRELFSGLVWHPLLLLLVGIATLFFGIVVLSGVIRFAAIFVRGRIYFGDTLNITTWALMPAVLLLPLGLVLVRLDRNEATVLLALWSLGIIFLWQLQRLMKGIGVLFDIYPTRVYIYCGIGLALFCFGVLFYCNLRYSTIAYLGYFVRLKDAIPLK